MSFAQQHRTLDRVRELADVTRPVVALEQRLRAGVEAVDLFLQRAREPVDESVRQRHDIVLALTQRRQLDRHDVQAIV